MDDPSILILAGPPGAGKTTVARRLADRYDRLVLMETDWFWTTIARGFVEPWRPEADAQNRAVLRAIAAAAAQLAAAGYPVLLDGVFGPWHLDAVTDALAPVPPAACAYVVLRPALDVALARAAGRSGHEVVPGHPALTDEGPVRHMWAAFCDLGPYERHVIDTSTRTPDEVADQVWRACQEAHSRLAG